MNFELELNQYLLDERYDEGIMGCLMYENFNGEIVDSGKKGDREIYAELKRLEKEKGVKF
jgi:hypothetical protein